MSHYERIVKPDLAFRSRSSCGCAVLRKIYAIALRQLSIVGQDFGLPLACPAGERDWGSAPIGILR